MDSKKLFILFFAAFFSCMGVMAQDGKRFHHNVQFAAGLSMGMGNNNVSRDSPGLSTRLEYGLDIKVKDAWSVMPGVAYQSLRDKYDFKQDFLDIDYSGGESSYSSGMAALFCMARYCFEFNKTKLHLGVGPQVTINTNHPANQYGVATYNPHNPKGSLVGKQKLQRFGFDLVPSAVFTFWNHWLVGVEASIGLRNMMIQYPEHNCTGNIRLFTLMFTTGVAF